MHEMAGGVHGRRLCHAKINGICEKIHARFCANEMKSVGHQRRKKC